jgi:NitT/TauT family transport system substrate-binding protein
MVYHYSRRVGVLTVAAAMLIVAGCSAYGSTQPEITVEKPDLTVGIVPTIDSTGFFVAMHEGLFTAQGLHITYKAVPSGEGSINEQALGKLDFLDSSYVSDIEAQVNYDNGVRAVSVPSPSVHQIAANLDFIAGASVMQPNSVGLFTLPRSPIRTVSDLPGKIIGINAPGNVAYLLIAEFLSSNGISPSSVTFKYYPFQDMAHELLTHNIDAAFLSEPFLSSEEESAGLAELTNLDGGAAEALPMRGYTVTRQFARRYPKTVAAFERALEQGQEIADTNRQAAQAAMEAFHATDDVTPQIAAIMTYDSYPLGPADSNEIQRVADDMTALGLLKHHFSVRQMVG